MPQQPESLQNGKTQENGETRKKAELRAAENEWLPDC